MHQSVVRAKVRCERQRCAAHSAAESRGRHRPTWPVCEYGRACHSAHSRCSWHSDQHALLRGFVRDWVLALACDSARVSTKTREVHQVRIPRAEQRNLLRVRLPGRAVMTFHPAGTSEHSRAWRDALWQHRERSLWRAELRFGPPRNDGGGVLLGHMPGRSRTFRALHTNSPGLCRVLLRPAGEQLLAQGIRFRSFSRAGRVASG